jgi:hypothetical protein
MQQVITRHPDIMHGVPVFRGTRVPVQTLFDYLEGGETLEDFLEGFPTVPRVSSRSGRSKKPNNCYLLAFNAATHR